MKISNTYLMITLLVLLFGGIILASLLGFWNSDGEGGITSTTIKGSSSLESIAKSNDIPLEDIAGAFHIPEKDADSLNAKDIKNYNDTDYDIGVASLKFFVAAYKGTDYELTEDVYLYQSAVDIIIQNGAPSDEQIQYMTAHTVLD